MQNSISYNCQCSERVEERGVAATVSFANESILLCDNFWMRMRYFGDVGPSVLLHEATHLCGSADISYFNNLKRPQNSKINKESLYGIIQMLVHKVGAYGNGRRQVVWPSTLWYSIADTYRYWAYFGFCIPEVNCYQ